MTNFVQLLPETHPLVVAAITELRAFSLRVLDYGDVETIDATDGQRSRLRQHLAHVGDHHAVLRRLEYNEVFSVCPRTKELFGALGINEVPDVNYFQLFVSHPGTRGVVHIDGRDRHCCLNLPIFNAEAGSIEWFGTHGFPAAPSRVSHVGTIGTYPEEFQHRYTNDLPDETVITRGLQLVRTDIWHRVNNTRNPRFRLIFSLRLMNNPTFEETVDQILPLALRLQLPNVDSQTNV